MEQDLIEKIRIIIAKGENIDEDGVRSLMILIRKLLDKMSQSNQNLYLTLRLFCNWVAHIEITQSNTGLRILAGINDALVRVKDSTDLAEIQKKTSNAIGFSVLRQEIKLFFKNIVIDDNLVSINKTWVLFLGNLIEIIRDVPLSFPPLSKLTKSQKKIYNQIAQNPIKNGAGIISAKISLIKYPPPVDEIMCLMVRMEDTTTIVIPLLINVGL